MANTPILVVKTVTTAGTRIQVDTDTDHKPIAIYFEAPATNTGQIYIGDSAVSSTNYFARLTIPSTVSAPSWQISGVPGGRAGSTALQLSNFWVDSSVSGDKVHITYLYSLGA